MCAAAAAFVHGRCLFGGAAACSSADDPSRLKSSCGWGWGRGRRYLSQCLANPDHNLQNKILPPIQIQIQKQKAPWLMLSWPINPQSGCFYDLLNGGAGGGQLQEQDGDDGMLMLMIEFNREIDLPQIAGHHCIGSSQGFLITVDRNADIHATNPITGARLPLPSTATLPNVLGVARDPATGYIKYYVSSRKGTDKPPQVRLQARPLFFEDRRRKDSRLIFDLKLELYRLGSGLIYRNHDFMQFHYYGRAVISPGLDFAAVTIIQGGFTLPPVFARLGQDTSWTALPALKESVHDVHDMTFRDGRLYTIDKRGTLAIFDLDNPSSPPFRSSKGPLGTDALRRPRYLVGSPDGDDLFLLEREINFCNSGRALRTETFTVYKLDRSKFKWRRVTSIADYALFVGTNDSVALSARDYPCIKPNSIYFTDFFITGVRDYRDAGVFNLEDRSILPMFHEKFNWPLPMWFTPAMF